MTKRIIWDTQAIPPRSEIGGKAYNLMRMKQAGIPTPKFFTILSDGSSDYTLDDAILAAACSLGDDLIVRSCHLHESGKFPFSGKFASIPCWQPQEKFPKDYSEVRQSAHSQEVAEYVVKNNIVDFNPDLMHTIVMPHIWGRVFSMYLTSAQTDPTRMIINQRDNKTKCGSWEVYNKASDTVETSGLDSFLLDAYLKLGRVGVEIEKLFGKTMQVEATVDKGGQLFVFQAKDMDMLVDVATRANYKTLVTGLRANGYCDFSGKVLVLDDYEKTFGWNANSEDPALRAEYKSKVRQFISENKNNYAVYLGHLTDHLDSHARNSEEQYAFINEVVAGAKVQFRDKAQSIVRHESWDKVEKNGAIIFVPYEERGTPSLTTMFTPRMTDGLTLQSKVCGKDVIYGANGKLLPVELCYRPVIATGDTINVICNKDGVFVW